MLEQRTLSVRNRFTGRDFDFLTSVLASGEQRLPLAKLWRDPDTRRELLDLKEVLLGLLDSTAVLQVSPRFYFYVLVRHAFRRSGIEDASLAEYVAGVLTKRVSAAPEDCLHDAAHGYTRVADFCSLITHAQARLTFLLQVAAGDQFLILTGLYPAFLKRRHACEGDVDLGFYETFAQKAFRAAALSGHAHGGAAQATLHALADALPAVRLALNGMVDEWIFLGDTAISDSGATLHRTVANPRPFSPMRK